LQSISDQGQVIDAYEAKELAEAKLEKWEEATTPSADTKKAYMGEFTFSIDLYLPGGDSDLMQVTVPWKVIKDIMREISARAE